MCECSLPFARKYFIARVSPHWQWHLSLSVSLSLACACMDWNWTIFALSERFIVVIGTLECDQGRRRGAQDIPISAFRLSVNGHRQS